MHSEAVARLQPDHLAQLDTEGFVVVERYIDSTTVEEATAELGQIHAGLPLAGASAAREGRPLFKANAQDSQVRDDLICWLSAEDAEAWGCPALGDIARSVLGVIKPIEARRPSWASLLSAPRKCMVSNYQGPRGHYVAHRDGVPRDMCADTVAAAKQQMHDLVKAGDWAYSGSLIPFMKDAGAAMKTQHESKHARREITAICYLNPDDWEERDGGSEPATHLAADFPHGLTVRACSVAALPRMQAGRRDWRDCDYARGCLAREGYAGPLQFENDAARSAPDSASQARPLGLVGEETQRAAGHRLIAEDTALRYYYKSRAYHDTATRRSL